MKIFDISLIKIKNMPVIPCRTTPEAIIKRAVNNIDTEVKNWRYSESGRAVMAFGFREERLLPMYRVPCERLRSETGDV
jgi:hypothetical protein